MYFGQKFKSPPFGIASIGQVHLGKGMPTRRIVIYLGFKDLVVRLQQFDQPTALNLYWRRLVASRVQNKDRRLDVLDMVQRRDIDIGSGILGDGLAAKARLLGDIIATKAGLVGHVGDHVGDTDHIHRRRKAVGKAFDGQRHDHAALAAAIDGDVVFLDRAGGSQVIGSRSNVVHFLAAKINRIVLFLAVAPRAAIFRENDDIAVIDGRRDQSK